MFPLSFYLHSNVRKAIGTSDAAAPATAAGAPHAFVFADGFGLTLQGGTPRPTTFLGAAPQPQLGRVVLERPRSPDGSAPARFAAKLLASDPALPQTALVADYLRLSPQQRREAAGLAHDGGGALLFQPIHSCAAALEDAKARTRGDGRPGSTDNSGSRLAARVMNAAYEPTDLHGLVSEYMRLSPDARSSAWYDLLKLGTPADHSRMDRVENGVRAELAFTGRSTPSAF